MEPPPQSALPGCTRDVSATGRTLTHLLLAVFVALAASGLLGGGPWPAASIERDGIHVEYARVLHAREPSRLDVHVARVEGPVLLIELPSATLRELVLERITPHPLRQRGTPDGTLLEIAAHPGRSAAVALHVSAQTPGWRRTVLRLPPHQLEIHQLVLP